MFVLSDNTHCMLCLCGDSSRTPTLVHAAVSNGALRLVDTESTQFGGRLEVYYNSEWGTVCDDSWGSSDATVACRQMGFVGVSDSDSSLFGSGSSSQRIWLDDVACSGSESRLIDCGHAGIGNENCFHSEDVGIVCSNINGKLNWDGSRICNYTHNYTRLMFVCMCNCACINF